jgi:hypothetical protein
MSKAALWLGLLTSAPALAADPADGAAEPSTETEQGAPVLDWYGAWSHAMRFDVSLGRWTGRDLGAGGLALQFEWWPTAQLSYTARTWMQAIRVPSEFPDTPPALREATGFTVGVQIGNPGPFKALAGASAGVAFVNGRMPPSDRWANRAVPFAGVVEGHAGFTLMVAPVTVHVLGWVHLYSEGPPVFSLSFGGGPMLEPGKGIDQP